MRICTSMCLCYTIGKMMESSGGMDGGSIIIFLLCARAKNGTLETQIQCHMPTHNTHIHDITSPIIASI